MSAGQSRVCVMLCTHPIMLHSEELYQEQKQKFGNPDGTFRDMTYEDLKDLPLLDSVIRETLRMHAPIQ